MNPQEKREFITMFLRKQVYAGKAIGAIMEVKQVK